MSTKKVYIETYGCQMNEYDTELVRAVLQKENYTLVENESEADIVMLNTCSVRENANRKVYNRIHTLRRERNGQPVMIGVLGCMASNFRQKLLENRNFNIDFVIGPDSYKRLPQLLKAAETRGEKAYDVTLSEFEDYADVYPSRQGGVNAWIAVMRGCNNFCTFCVVPYTRGRERSRSPLNIIEEVRRLVDEGYQQVTLLGQNVNSYHHQGKDFAYLLERVSRVKGIERVRFTSPHPKDFPHELLHVVAENPKVCKHIHLPLQAGSSRILNSMNRTYTKEEYLKLVDDIRQHYPRIVITTDVIVGFPTETDEEFAETHEVMEKVQFDAAFIFKYSERKGTIAARKYPDDVSAEKKKERIVRLNELQNSISLRKNQAHIGEVQWVLIEEESTRKSLLDVQGRNDGNKIVIFPRDSHRKGDFVDVLIQGATPHVLRGKVVEHS
ncbi:MAG: tRNA (N6-isopentenyl adenosine(37)-C2)-methylthiotransferase MiaB [Caldithrix sp. RBG_13_44_9]|nr:MAG: tRNA (N6-isopentenyl adenosine(37)-C2)-methylthiotransferase MiaB [Caldithrix sp. RBG_13_44_9]